MRDTPITHKIVRHRQCGSRKLSPVFSIHIHALAHCPLLLPVCLCRFKVTNIGASELINGAQNPTIVLGLVWQLVKIHLLNNINLKNHPELVRLLEANEELSDLLKLPPEQLLLRWFNYHLKNAGHPKRITNFSSDVKDSEAYTILLHQISPQHCDTSAHSSRPTRCSALSSCSTTPSGWT